MKTRLFIMVCLLFSLTSCNKWLDVELENKVDEDKLFSTAEGFQEALAGVYSQMAGKSMYGQALTMEYVDLMGQYYSYNSVGTAYTYFKDFNYTNSGVKSTIASFWKNLYNCIASANNILNWADKNKGVLGESNRNQVRGEALALRAFLHFDLYRLFCPDVKLSPRAEGIPYNKEFGVSLPPMYTVEEIVQLVINDLKEAETLLANDPIVSIVPYTLSSKSDADKYVARMNLYGVKAMLARVYQAKGDNVKAVAYAKEVIESGKFRLLEFASVDQTEALTDVLFSDEHIFSLRNKELKDYSEKLHRDESKNGVTSFKPLPFGSYYNWYEGNNDDVRYSKWFNLTDLNGDNFIGDLYFAGSPLPLAHGGWVNELQWKNFDLNVLFNFSIGRKIINEKAGSLNVVGPKFVDYRDLHWWTDPGCDANMPKLGFDVKTNIDTNIEKVNSITLKQITLGYNAPKVWVRKVGLSGVRLFATIENLCYLSNYAGENPEVIDIYSGRDKGTQYPLPRKWTLGLTLNF